MKIHFGFRRMRGCMAVGLALLLILALLQPALASASERKSVVRTGERLQQPGGKARKVTPLPPERGVPSLNLPNLDELRQRRSQDVRTPPPIQSTMRSRRKSGRPAPDKKAHHRRSRSALTANPSYPSTTQPAAPQSGESPFTNDPLKNPNDPDSFEIKAVHITELRAAIDTVRHHRHLPNYPWVKPAPNGAINTNVLISWEPIQEMRNALDQAIGPPPHGYTPGLGYLQPILADHITELRERVKDVLGVSSLADQLIPPRLDPFNQSGNQIEARDAEWSLPLISLPGRAGLDLNIGLSYSSMIWTQAASSISFDDDWGDPSPGFKLGFPTVQGPFINNLLGTKVYILITSAGRRVELRRAGTLNVYEAGDSSYLQLIESSGRLLLRTTDGTQMTYNLFSSGWHCMSIEDRNGNVVVANYNPLGDITTVSDTLGRTFSFEYDGNNNLRSINQTWTVNGASQTHSWATFGWGTVTVHPAFSGVNVIGVFNGEVIPVLTQVGLPDASHYNFEYNDYGQVQKISLYAADGGPGIEDDLRRGYFAYDYEYPSAECPRITAARVWARNWSDVAGVPHEVPAYFADNHDGSHQMITRDGTVYKEFYGAPGDLPAWQHGLVTSMQVISGSTVQKTTTTAYTQDNTSVNYQTNPKMYQTLVSDGANNRKTTIDYSNAAYLQYGLPTFVSEYAADATTEIRRTYIDYNLSQGYLDRRIIGLVSMQRVLGVQTNEWAAKTTYAYDQTVVSSQATTAVGHDQSYDSSLTVRGNVTSVSRWDINNINTPSTSTTMTYDAAGSLLSTSDPLGHTNSISYTDSFSDGINHNTFAYPTVIKDPDWNASNAPNNFSTVQYNYDFSATTRTQGPPPGNPGQYSNGVIQSFSYDNATRLQQTTTVNTGAYVHYDYGPDYTSSFASVNSVAAHYWESDSYSNRFFDGLGRVFAVASNHPGSQGGNKAQYTRYDEMGRAVQQTNPTEIDGGWNPTGDDVYNSQTNTGGWQFNVANTFDWKGRPLRTYNMDGTFKEASYAGCGCAGGEVVTLTDERQRQQRVYSDVLGRQVKTEVLNWNGSVYSTTVNTLNALDQLTLVRQTDNATGVYQDTTMSYDGYGRLATRKLPEQINPTTYSYNYDDAVSSVEDGRGATATYGYNYRHLVTSINYSAPTGITPTSTVTFGYDAAGNRTSMNDGSGQMNYNYDSLSRITAETRTFDGLSGSYGLGYTYNLAGELTSFTEPSQFGTSVSYGYDSTGRLTTVAASGLQTSSLMSNIEYRAFGALKHASYGDGSQLNLSYSSRTLMTRYELSNVRDTTTYPQAVTTMGTQNDYYADGRIHYAQDLRNGNFDRSYTYDHAARLQEATSGREARGLPPGTPADSPYKQTFTYDAWNNMGRTGRLWSQGLGDMPTYANNRRSDWYYDNEGNALLTSPNKMHDFDAAGKQAHAYEESWTDPTGNWVFHQDSIDQAYSGEGLPAKRIETRHSEDSQGHITDDVRTVYFLTSTVLGGVTVADISANGQRVGYVYVGGSKLVEYGGTPPYSSISFRHENPVTGNWVTLNTASGDGTRTEFDPLGATVGTIDPNPGSYVDMIGDDLLYRELGNPFDLGSGCRLDGMPAKCEDLDNRIQNGVVASEERFGSRRQAQLMGFGNGLFGVWVYDRDHHSPFPDPINSDVLVTNHEQDDQAGHYEYFFGRFPAKATTPHNPTVSVTVSYQIPPMEQVDCPDAAAESASGRGNNVILNYADRTREVRNGGSRSWRNNNPGNIRPGNLQGEIGRAGGFAVFSRESAGQAAIVELLSRPAYQALTVFGAINRWAPPVENDTAAYQARVQNLTGIHGQTQMNTLNQAQLDSVANAIRSIEGWTPGRRTCWRQRAQ